MNILNLWKFNMVTGLWDHMRTCYPDTAQQWLAVFQKEEPLEHFKLSKRRPTKCPL